MLLSGTIIHCQYLIVREFGKRNSGAIYLAVDTQNGARYFIQEIEQQTGKMRTIAHQECLKELNRLKQLHSAYALRVVEVLETDDSYLVCMDYVEGISLQSVIDMQGPASQADAVKWCIQLCDVLHKFHAHPHSALYCSIQPSNILLKPDGDIIMFGFDTACRGNSEGYTEQAGMKLPTLEQLNGGVPDARADIYSLGALLWYLLTGQSPGLPTPKAKLLGQIEILYAGTPIEKILWKCCQKDPEKRYRDVDALKSALSVLRNKLDPNESQQSQHSARSCLIAAVACLAFLAVIIVLLTRSEFSALEKQIGIIVSCVCTAFAGYHIIRQAIAPGKRSRTRPKEAGNEKIGEYTIPEQMTDYQQTQGRNDTAGKTAPLQKGASVQFEVTEKILFIHTDVYI